MEFKPIARKTQEDYSVLIWTDGASRNTGNKKGKTVNPYDLSGYGYFMKFGTYEKSFARALKGQTNNKMELRAPIEALKQMKRFDVPVIVYSDSAYLVNGINNGWYKGWIKRNWKTKDNKDVKNKEEWKQLVSLINKFAFITFKKTKGHADDKYNILVDKLINVKMDELTSQLLK